MGASTKTGDSLKVEQRGDIAWFVSPHGLGHAARSCAVMAACSSLRPGLRHHVFTTVPRAFFVDSLPGVSLTHHRCECDVGMVQHNPMEEDVEGTIRALAALWPDPGPSIDEVTTRVAATGSGLIVGDIAPLALVVAHRLGLSGVLVENFTWDWIYRAYGNPQLDRVGRRMAEVVRSASLRIQTEPVCRVADGAQAVSPVSRPSRMAGSEVRRRLGVPDDHRMILLSMGGLQAETIRGLPFRLPPRTTLVAVGNGGVTVREEGLILTGSRGGPYHPDLVAASDLVVGKLGYSTVAEVHHGRSAYAYLRRERFPESPILEAFVREHLPSAPLAADWIDNRKTASIVEELFERPSPVGERPNGASRAAELIVDLLTPP